MSDYKSELLERFRSRDARVAIIGLGYVGLPLAVAFGEAGYHVVGIDMDGRKVDALRSGESYIEDVAAESVRGLVQRGRLEATSDFSALAGVDAVSICVPTPLNKTGDPDMSYIVSASREVAHHLHPGMVVVLESTT